MLLSLLLLLLFTLPVHGLQAITYQIKKTIPLPTSCFTQGFSIVNQQIFLSCGLYRQSHLLKLNLQGEGLLKKNLPAKKFAEGMTIVDQKLYLLDWKSQKLSIYNIDDFSFIEDKNIADINEAWGLALLTTQDQQLILSDGTNQLRFLNINNLNTVNRLKLFDEQHKAITDINELEVVDRLIFANLWQHRKVIVFPQPSSETNEIAVGHVIDFSDDIPLFKRFSKREVLNGIAYDAENDCLWLTGKKWGKAFALALTLPESLKPYSRHNFSCKIPGSAQ